MPGGRVEGAQGMRLPGLDDPQPGTAAAGLAGGPDQGGRGGARAADADADDGLAFAAVHRSLLPARQAVCAVESSLAAAGPL